MRETYAKLRTAAAVDTDAEVATVSRLAFVTLALICAATWVFGHTYVGIFHDARQYTLQALAHLMPGSLGHDIFLRFGSQDRYTIFSAVYATAIRLLGVQPAAAALTVFFQVSFVLAAWLLARTFLSAHLALFAVTILIAIPGTYGPDHIFKVMEDFVSPRLPAEALGLAAVAAAFVGKKVSAVACFVGAALLHPIMAAAVAFAALCVYVAIPHPRLAGALTVGGVLVLVTGALLFPVGIFRSFDASWLGLVRERSPYLFISYWGTDDWSGAAIPLATLAAGWRILPVSRARTLCQAAFLTGVAGLGLTLLACDWLHMVLLTQLQPWRWEWLAVAAGALTLPLIIWNCWQTDYCGRACALLLASAWVFGSNEFALASIAAAAAAIMLIRRLPPNEAHLVFIGSGLVLSVALVWRISFNLSLAGASFSDPRIPDFVWQIRSFTYDGTVLIAVALLALWLARRARSGVALAVLAAVLFSTCVALLPATWNRWSHWQYTSALHGLLAPWRQLIPPGADVFWPALPVGTWLLLERPNYLSDIQTSGVLFSREAALEMKRRADELSAIVPEAAFWDWKGGEMSPPDLTLRQMAMICKTSRIPFLVTNMNLHIQPIATLPRRAGSISDGLKLYRCSGSSD